MRDRLFGLGLLTSGVMAGFVGMWLRDFWWMQLAFGLLTLRICWELWPEPPGPNETVLRELGEVRARLRDRAVKMADEKGPPIADLLSGNKAAMQTLADAELYAKIGKERRKMNADDVARTEKTARLWLESKDPVSELLRSLDEAA